MFIWLVFQNWNEYSLELLSFVQNLVPFEALSFITYKFGSLLFKGDVESFLF